MKRFSARIARYDFIFENILDSIQWYKYEWGGITSIVALFLTQVSKWNLQQSWNEQSQCSCKVGVDEHVCACFRNIAT